MIDATGNITIKVLSASPPPPPPSEFPWWLLAVAGVALVGGYWIVKPSKKQRKK